MVSVPWPHFTVSRVEPSPVSYHPHGGQLSSSEWSSRIPAGQDGASEPLPVCWHNVVDDPQCTNTGLFGQVPASSDRLHQLDTLGSWRVPGRAGTTLGYAQSILLNATPQGSSGHVPGVFRRRVPGRKTMGRFPP